MMTPLEELNAAIQKFALALGEESLLIDVCVVVWEQVTIDDDGDVKRQVMYTVPTDNFSISSALGLLNAGRVLVQRDTLGTEDE